MHFRLLITLILFQITSQLFGQKPASDYFITQVKDTVYCYDLNYNTNTWGYINFLSYTQLDGTPIKYQSKKIIPVILTLYINGQTLDRIPLKPKSKHDVIYLKRTVDGPLKVYLQHQNQSYNSNGTVMYIFYIKLPDGPYYQVNKKLNMSQVIVPYLKKCSAFTDQYDGDYSNKEEPFIEMIRLYNQLCPTSN